jgi:hypothetical protein
MKTHVFGIGQIEAGFLTLGSATDDEGEALRFRAVGVAPEVNGRVQFHAHLQQLDEIGVVACMVTCERSELPQKVWVSAQVKEGRIEGLGKTNIQACEVMGILGGVLHELVLFIDPILPVNKEAVKSAGKKKKRNPVASGPVTNEDENHSSTVNAAPADRPQASSLELTASPPEAAETPKESVVGNDEIRPLHDRVEVLNPQPVDPFPCTSSQIPILDNETGNKVTTTGKGRKKKQEAGATQEKSNNENGVHSTDGQNPEEGEGNHGLTTSTGTNGSALIDPDLMLKGEDGKDISDRELLF